MKRGILILLSLSVLVAVGYFTATKWAIRHETIAFHDPARDNRLVAVTVAVIVAGVVAAGSAATGSAAAAAGGAS